MNKIRGSIPDIKENGVYTWKIFMRLKCSDKFCSANSVFMDIRRAIIEHCGHDIYKMGICTDCGSEYSSATRETIYKPVFNIPETEEMMDFINKFDPSSFRKIVEADGILKFIDLEIVGTIKERGNENE